MNRRPASTPRRTHALLIGSLIVVLGCQPSDPATSTVALPALPVPAHLDQVDPPVRQQYEERRAALDGLLADDDTEAKRLGEVYGALGTWHHAYDDKELARLAYQHAVEHAPQAGRWRYYLGLIHGALGETEAARDQLETFLRLEPDDAPARVHLAAVELAAGQADAAGTLLRAALEHQPDNPRALAMLGRVALEQRDFDTAVEHLERALELQPGRAKIHYSLGLAYRGVGDRERAREHMAQGQIDNRDKRDASMADPLLAEVHALDRGSRTFGQQGRRAFVEGDFAHAIEQARQAVAANPEAAQPRLNLGAALLRAGRPEEAVGELERVLELSPGHPIGHFNLGATFYRLGQWPQATEHYQAAVTANPGFKEAHFNLANLQRFQGDFATALPSYERVVELDPGLALARLWRVVCLHELGRVAEARHTLEADLGQLRQAVPLQVLYTRLLANADDPAVRDPQQGLRLARSLHQARPTLASAEAVATGLARTGDLDAAVAWQRQALEAVREAADGKTLARVAQRLDLFRRGSTDDTVWSVDEHRGADLPVPAPEGAG